MQRLLPVAGEPTTSPPEHLTVVRRMVDMASSGSEREKIDELPRLAPPLIDSTARMGDAA